MNPNEFFYWLQGYFELTPPAPPTDACPWERWLSAAQADCILRHVALVMEWLGDGKRGGGAHPQTIARLHEVRTFAQLLNAERPDAMRAEFTACIRTIVHEQFVHVIDPQAGDAETQAKLNKIHDSPRPDVDWNKPVKRC